MTPVTRGASARIQAYVDQVDEEDYTVPPDATLRCISAILDASFHRAYEATTNEMKTNPLLEKGVEHLHKNRTCKGFKLKNASLEDLTAFEQMYAVSRYIEEHPNMSRQPRTYAFKAGDDAIVPVWVRHPPKGKASLWTTLLGTTQGNLKAPSYGDMARTDPLTTDQEVFIDPLTYLEMHRNSPKIGALVIKSSSYEAERIDHEWRFQNYNENGETFLSASAELKKQKSAPTQRMVDQAAGFNFCELLKGDGEHDTQENLIPELRYEDYADDGYRDDIVPFVTPKSILKTFPDALRGQTEDLDTLTQRIFSSRLGHSKMDKINRDVVATLFDEDQIDLGCIF